MDNNILNEIMELCIIPLLGVLTCYLVQWIRVKTTEIKDKSNNELHDKYVGMLSETVIDCVIATNQTYVEALKNKDAFDVEAQKVAFQMTYDAVLAILTDDAKAYLTSTTGDLQIYLTKLIEKEVNKQKG